MIESLQTLKASNKDNHSEGLSKLTTLKTDEFKSSSSISAITPLVHYDSTSSCSSNVPGCGAGTLCRIHYYGYRTSYHYTTNGQYNTVPQARTKAVELELRKSNPQFWQVPPAIVPAVSPVPMSPYSKEALDKKSLLAKKNITIERRRKYLETRMKVTSFEDIIAEEAAKRKADLLAGRKPDLMTYNYYCAACSVSTGYGCDGMTSYMCGAGTHGYLLDKTCMPYIWLILNN